MVELQPPPGRGVEYLPQSAAHVGVLRGRDQACRSQPLDVTQAAQHIPGHQPSIPDPVVAGGVLEQPLIRGAGAPERGRRSMAISRTGRRGPAPRRRPRAAVTSGMSTYSSAVCDRRLVPGPHLMASHSRKKTQSEQVGLPNWRAAGRSWVAVASRREPAGVSQGTSRREVTITSQVSADRSSWASSSWVQSGVLRTSSTARATGGVTFRLTPASSMVAVAVARPSTGCDASGKQGIRA